jgi:hypothetical protein
LEYSFNQLDTKYFDTSMDEVRFWFDFLLLEKDALIVFFEYAIIWTTP